MSDRIPNNKKNSLFPQQPFEEEDDESWQVSYLDIITIVLGFLIILLSFSQLKEDERLSISNLFDSSVVETEYITTPIEDIKTELEEFLREDIENGSIAISRDLNDLRIRFRSDDFYSSGSAKLKPQGLKQLSKVLLAIKETKYDDFNIDVEGHTDSSPISSAVYPSNWELSTARASNVVKYFNGLGIPVSRLKASGYADSRPLVVLNSLGNQLPATKEMNRRIVLRLYYTLEKDIAEAQSQKAITEPTVQPIPESDIVEVEPEATKPVRSCSFSVQIGGFESFFNALNIAEEVEKNTTYEIDIFYNTNLFSVRTKTRNSLSEALKIQKVISSRMATLETTAIIQQCYNSKQVIPTPLRYQIQLGYFQTKQNADNFVERLLTEYQLQTEVKQFSPNAYTVLTISNPSLKASLEKLSSYNAKNISPNIFIRYVPVPFVDYNFTIQLQIGTFSSKDKALESSQNILTNLDIESTVSDAIEGKYYLYTAKISSWTKSLELFEQIQASELNLEPIIYLVEYN